MEPEEPVEVKAAAGLVEVTNVKREPEGGVEMEMKAKPGEMMETNAEPA